MPFSGPLWCVSFLCALEFRYYCGKTEKKEVKHQRPIFCFRGKIRLTYRPSWDLCVCVCDVVQNCWHQKQNAEKKLSASSFLKCKLSGHRLDSVACIKHTADSVDIKNSYRVNLPHIKSLQGTSRDTETTKRNSIDGGLFVQSLKPQEV